MEKGTRTRTLVTGGAGFIGSNLVKELVKQGDIVTILDDFSTGKIENLKDINIDKIKIVVGSVCNLNLMKKLMNENDRIFHLVATCLVSCNENPIIANEANVTGI